MPLPLTPDFHYLFESLPGLYMILKNDSTIVAATNSYLKATLTQREEIMGKNVFEVFPENPDDLAANSANSLRASLTKVLEEKKPHAMPTLKYDIKGQDGSYEVRHWQVVNTPLFNENKEVGWIINQVEDVTNIVKSKQEELKQKQLIQESKKMNIQLRQLSEHLQNMQEDERANIARMIQNDLGQQMKEMKMNISWLARKLNGQDDSFRQKMEDLLPMLDKSIEITRKIATELRPGLLDNMGLLAAIEWYLKEFEKKTGIFTTYISTITEPFLPGLVKTSLFRIVQESLTNVSSHAMARSVVVNVELEGIELVLTIQDNGIGFNKNETAGKKALGILGMKERAAVMGATYDIDSTPGNGSKVVVKVTTDWEEQPLD